MHFTRGGHGSHVDIELNAVYLLPLAVTLYLRPFCDCPSGCHVSVYLYTWSGFDDQRGPQENLGTKIQALLKGHAGLAVPCLSQYSSWRASPGDICSAELAAQSRKLSMLPFTLGIPHPFLRVPFLNGTVASCETVSLHRHDLPSCQRS